MSDRYAAALWLTGRFVYAPSTAELSGHCSPFVRVRRETSKRDSAGTKSYDLIARTAEEHFMNLIAARI
jgi:hypothetical protein